MLTLYWRAAGPGRLSWTVFAHLLDAENRVWGQHDGLPGAGKAPSTGWAEGEVVEDGHEIVVKPDAPAGDYEIEVGLYDGASGERLPLAEGGDRVILGKIRIARRRHDTMVKGER